MDRIIHLVAAIDGGRGSPDPLSHPLDPRMVLHVTPCYVQGTI